MTKKRNYENEEEFKNFNLEDYLPSQNSRKPEDIPSASGQETTIFTPLDKPNTSAIQVAVSKAIQPDEQEVLETSDADEEVKETSTWLEVVSERTIVRHISSKQRRLSLEEYRTTYLQVPKIVNRKPVFVSETVRDELDRVVRFLGGKGMSASGLIENLVRLHLDTYRNDIELWRKL